MAKKRFTVKPEWSKVWDLPGHCGLHSVWALTGVSHKELIEYVVTRLGWNVRGGMTQQEMHHCLKKFGKGSLVPVGAAGMKVSDLLHDGDDAEYLLNVRYSHSRRRHTCAVKAGKLVMGGNEDGSITIPHGIIESCIKVQDSRPSFSETLRQARCEA